MSTRIGVALYVGCLTTGVAWGGTQLEDTVSNCTPINCGAQTIRAVHQTNEPFVIQVFAGEGECLRLDVDSQTQDTVLLLASPSVLAHDYDDDRDLENDDFRPLYLLDPVPATGWWTVAVSYWDWAPTVAKFVLKYGRYPSGNPNCAAATASSASRLKSLGVNTSKAPVSKGTDVAISD
jgi:hypothetical protein